MASPAPLTPRGANMPNYRVRQGHKFGPSGQYSAGAVLELTEAEAKGHADKLERLPDGEINPSGSQRAEVAFGLQNELNAEVPAELKIIPPETEAEAVQEDGPEAAQDVQSPAKPKSQRKGKTEQ